MTTDYRTLKTNQGLALEAAADTGANPIKLTTLVVGDGGGDAVIPDARQTALIREVTRVKLNTVSQKEGDATQWVAEAVIPADNGGYTVREVGLLTDDGVLFAVGNFPATYKPRPDEGTAGQLTVTMNFKAQNADNITLMIDANVAVATRKWVEDTLVSGDYASHADLRAEIQRSQNAETGIENAKVNRSGDTMSGTLTIAGGGSAGNTAFGGKVASIVTGNPENSFLQTQIIDNKPYAVLGVQDAQGGWHTWYFNAIDGMIRTPQGHTVLEVDDVGDGHVVVRNVGSASNKTVGMMDDINAEKQRAEAAEAGLQPKGPYVPSSPRNGHNDDQVNNIVYDIDGGNPAISVVGVGFIPLQKAGDYATQHDLSAESQRAQNAEAGLQPRGDYALRSELSNLVGTDPDNGDYQVNKLGVNKENGQIWGYNTASNKFFYFQTAGDYATQAELSVETNRAQNAENQLMPRSGGTMSGSLVLSVTEKWSFGRGGGVTTQAMADGPERFYQQIYRGNGGLTQGILGVADETGDRQWKLLANSAILTPSGNTLLETRGVPGRVVTQYFRISNLANVNYIPFPAPFASNDPANEIFITYGYGYNNNGGVPEGSVLYIYKQKTTNAGFWIDRSESGFQDAAFDVVATGPMQ